LFLKNPRQEDGARVERELTQKLKALPISSSSICINAQPYNPDLDIMKVLKKETAEKRRGIPTLHAKTAYSFSLRYKYDVLIHEIRSTVS